jgi:hypothetical protein
MLNSDSSFSIEYMNITENVKIEIDFSNLEEIYVDNDKEFILILQKIQQEYIKYLGLLEEQIRAENMEEFRKTRHKISATLLLLKLEEFHNYLSFLKEHFSNGFNDKEEAIAVLRTCFSKTQEILANKLAQLIK